MLWSRTCMFMRVLNLLREIGTGINKSFEAEQCTVETIS